MFCRKCGTQIEPGVKFCPKCGTPVAENAQDGQGYQNVQNGQNMQSGYQQPQQQSNPSYQQPQQPNPYQQTVYVQNTPAPAHGMAIGSLVCGIVGVIFVFFNVFAFIGTALGVVGLILASMAKSRGNTEGARTAGFVLSLIAVIICAITAISCLACVGCGAAGLGALGSSLGSLN